VWSAREFWKRLTSTRYTRALERELERAQAENFRLRAENRALLNSILGIAGLPPISVEAQAAADEKTGAPEGAPTENQPRVKRPAGNLQNVAPMRRRSWHQVHRMLELQAARKQSEES
jgi:hypothetical protein